MPNWRGLVSIYDEWIAVLFIFTAAERLRSTKQINGRLTLGRLWFKVFCCCGIGVCANVCGVNP
jgi:hypothetical protein